MSKPVLSVRWPERSPWEQTTKLRMASTEKTMAFLHDKEATGLWIALHRPDGAELTADDAPGYRREPWNFATGCKMSPAIADWGGVSFVSIWTREIDGVCVSSPPLQEFKPEWLLR